VSLRGQNHNPPRRFPVPDLEQKAPVTRMLAFVEHAVRDTPKKVSIVGKLSDVAPNFFGTESKIIVAETLEPFEHHIDLGLRETKA
jgi:hypothetical protein